MAVVRCRVAALRLRCGDASVGLNRGGSLVVEAAHLIVRHERREYGGSAADEEEAVRASSWELSTVVATAIFPL